MSRAVRWLRSIHLLQLYCHRLMLCLDAVSITYLGSVTARMEIIMQSGG